MPGRGNTRKESTPQHHWPFATIISVFCFCRSALTDYLRAFPSASLNRSFSPSFLSSLFPWRDVACCGPAQGPYYKRIRMEWAADGGSSSRYQPLSHPLTRLQPLSNLPWNLMPLRIPGAHIPTEFEDINTLTAISTLRFILGSTSPEASSINPININDTPSASPSVDIAAATPATPIIDLS